MHVKKLKVQRVLRKSFLSDDMMCPLGLTWSLSLQLHVWSRFHNVLAPLDFRRIKQCLKYGQVCLVWVSEETHPESTHTNPADTWNNSSPLDLPTALGQTPAERLFQEPAPQRFHALFGSKKAPVHLLGQFDSNGTARNASRTLEVQEVDYAADDGNEFEWVRDDFKWQIKVNNANVLNPTLLHKDVLKNLKRFEMHEFLKNT